MAKLWPEGPFMKVGRPVFAAILRTKCNLTSNGVSSRILMELSESVSLFSLPAAHSAVLTGAGNPLSSFCFFLSSAQLSSHQLLTVIPIQRQELLCLFHCLLYLVRSVTVPGKAMIYAMCHWATFLSGEGCTGMWYTGKVYHALVISCLTFQQKRR